MEQLGLDIDIVRERSLRPSVQAMVEELGRRNLLGAEDAPIVALFYKLADALDAAGGRGASVAMLSAQFQEVWRQLAALVSTGEDQDDAEDYDVVLLQPAQPDDEPPALLHDAS